MQSVEQAEEESYLIPVDKYIVMVDNRKDKRLLVINANKHFKWRKTPIQLSQLAKFHYYQELEVGNQQLTPLPEQILSDEEPDNDEDEEVDNNNREIYTLEDAQKLDVEAIEKMKKELKPQEIISSLVQNNEQFEKRTEYSKLKYLNKKKKKYMFHIHAEPVSIENVHAFYYTTDVKSIGYIRWDMLALLLLHAGPIEGANILLAEKTKGILLASLLIKNANQIVFASHDPNKTYKNFPIVEQFNIKKEKFQQKVSFTTWNQIIEINQTQTNKPHLQKFTNVVLFGNYDFQSLLLALKPRMKSGCSITFFCISLEPLVKAVESMNNEKQCKYLNTKINDSWCREYQVLKNRTHPMMSMDGCSGYLLTAIFVNA